MTSPSQIGPETTVAELLAIRPEARPALEERQIDLCCGGALTLRQAAEARGIDLDDLVAAVREPGVPAPPVALVTASDSVRDVLARFPRTAAVFESHGLTGCGGAAGPDERIDLFSTIHRIDVQTLLGELNRAAADATEASVAAIAERPVPPIYPGFLKAALWSTVTLGASFGAYNLAMIHLALGPVPPVHNWVHAGFQIWGFVFLFIVGVSYHALPRFFGAELKHPGLARATLWAAILAILLVAYGRIGPLFPATLPALAIGGALELFAVVGWAYVLVATVGRPRPNEPFQWFLVAGTAWWCLAAALLAAGALAALRSGDVDAVADFNESIYAAALFGGALSWIQGMFLRTGPVFLGLAEPGRRSRFAAVAVWAVWAALAFGQMGALSAVLGAMIVGGPVDNPLTDVSLFLSSASVVAFVAAVRPFRRAARGEGDRDFARLVALAFAAALLFATLGASYAAIDLAGHRANKLLYDGARHAFTLGLVTTMIFAMAGRILPVFGGVELKWPALRRWGAYLIAFGVLAREAQIVAAALGDARPLVVSGLSGIVAATGVCLASASILATLYATSRPSAATEGAGPVPVSGGANVASLIAAHPEAIAILVDAGFTPLKNPLLRRTLARAITLEQACRMQRIDLDVVLDRIRRACPHEKPAEQAPPPGRRSLPVLRHDPR